MQVEHLLVTWFTSTTDGEHAAAYTQARKDDAHRETMYGRSMLPTPLMAAESGKRCVSCPRYVHARQLSDLRDDLYWLALLLHRIEIPWPFRGGTRTVHTEPSDDTNRDSASAVCACSVTRRKNIASRAPTVGLTCVVETYPPEVPPRPHPALAPPIRTVLTRGGAVSLASAGSKPPTAPAGTLRITSPCENHRASRPTHLSEASDDDCE